MYFENTILVAAFFRTVCRRKSHITQTEDEFIFLMHILAMFLSSFFLLLEKNGRRTTAFFLLLIYTIFFLGTFLLC